ncbi:MAG TPA: M48 family metalloprotease [Nitrospiraceae bacterium]|nr:M48 family metalloprotease [Nitrospiraceae bacterium]
MPVLQIGCSMNPVSGRPEFTLVSEEQENKLGAEEAKKVEAQMGLLDNDAFTPYLAQLGQRLAEQSPRQGVAYQFHLVDMEEPNAFALPGGYVYVTRGLLALTNSEDELAGVVGHEIGHVAARHSVQSISKRGPFAAVFGIVSGVTGLVSPLVGNIVGGIGDLTQGLIFSPYSRSQENEADEVGQGIAAKAGWDAFALSTFLSNLEREVVLYQGKPRKPSFFDSHPPTPERVRRTSIHATSLTRAPREPISAGKDVYLARLDGLVVGQRAANGILVDQKFFQPDLNFFLELPDKWKVENTPQMLVAAAPDGEGGLLLRTVAEGQDPLDGARALEKTSKAALVSKTERIKVGELPAARTHLKVDSQTELDLTWIAHGGLIYQIAGIAPVRRYQSMKPVLESTANSFRPLTAAEREAITENRIRLVKAQAGETVEALAMRSRSAWKPEEIAVTNGIKTSDRLAQGQLLKIAVTEPYRPRISH